MQENIASTESILLIIKVLSSVFFAILFLQSGLDKIIDRRGNLDWLTSHFEQSPLRSLVPALLGLLTALEVASGGFSAIGAALLLFTPEWEIAFYGTLLSCISLLSLFFGQRIAKDYPGAHTIATYFGVGLISLLLYTF